MTSLRPLLQEITHSVLNTSHVEADVRLTDSGHTQPHITPCQEVSCTYLDGVLLLCSLLPGHVGSAKGSLAQLTNVLILLPAVGATIGWQDPVTWLVGGRVSSRLHGRWIHTQTGRCGVVSELVPEMLA